MSNTIELISGILLEQCFRKLLLYPTELRGQFNSFIFHLELKRIQFCSISHRLSSSFITFHKIPVGKQWEAFISEIHRPGGHRVFRKRPS